MSDIDELLAKHGYVVPDVRFHLRNAAGLFKCFDRHSDTYWCFYAPWDDPFMLRFQTAEEAARHADAWDTVVRSIDGVKP